ncbi:MAG TPA: PIN domain-containing protein [Acidobacteriaceae bacterium]|nr:PIN domain-containing protein [Acidobacteriaceae bacterium]
MPAEVFFDTSVLVYVVTRDDPRSEAARSLLLDVGTVSVQVLNEFVSVTRRKLRMPWERIEEALSFIRLLCGEPVPITVTTHDAGLKIARCYGFHIYDSLMIAAAQDAGCTTLYSEDMQHGQRIGPVRIRNPFLH